MIFGFAVDTGDCLCKKVRWRGKTDILRPELQIERALSEPDQRHQRDQRRAARKHDAPVEPAGAQREGEW